MLKIFDRYVNIKNRDDLEDCTMELVEKLDQMLTEYGVAHAFSLASKEELGVSRRTLRTDIAYLKRVYPDKLITHRGRYTGGLEWVE